MEKDGPVHISRAHMCTPFLQIQRNRGEPSLASYDGAPGNIIKAKFYSFGMYRRGGRSQLTMRRAGCVWASSRAEIEEHGRWRTQSKVYKAMSEQYNKITPEDRIYITLFCISGMDLQIF
jgi:hypothetical protein